MQLPNNSCINQRQNTSSMEKKPTISIIVPVYNAKKIIKRIFPAKVWTAIRRYFIVRKHREVANDLKYLVDDCAMGKIVFPHLTKKVNLPVNGKIIWQYWAQGFEKRNMPELVRICLDSVERYSGEYRLIRLTDKNISEYIDIPLYIQEKKDNGVLPIAQFSDLLRLMLLATYGGVWLDACVLLTGELPELFYESIKNGRFFMYQRDSREPYKQYWENSFAYYFGYYKGFRVNVLNGIMCAGAANEVIKDLCKMLLSFWETHNQVPDYFFFQILFDLYIKSCPEKNCSIVNDCIPHMLRQIVNAQYPYMSVGEVMEKTSVHSLNYKNPDAANRLKELLSILC